MINISILDPSNIPYVNILPCRFDWKLFFAFPKLLVYKDRQMQLRSKIDLSEISFCTASLVPVLLLKLHLLRRSQVVFYLQVQVSIICSMKLFWIVVQYSSSLKYLLSDSIVYICLQVFWSSLVWQWGWLASEGWTVVCTSPWTTRENCTARWVWLKMVQCDFLFKSSILFLNATTSTWHILDSWILQMSAFLSPCRKSCLRNVFLGSSLRKTGTIPTRPTSIGMEKKARFTLLLSTKMGHPEMERDRGGIRGLLTSCQGPSTRTEYRNCTGTYWARAEIEGGLHWACQSF